MKKLFLLAALAISCFSYGQKSDTEQIAVDMYNFKAESVTIHEDQSVEYNGKVTFETGYIDIEHADKVIYYPKSQELIATGNVKAKLGYPIRIENNGRTHASIRYKLGDTVAYLE